MQVRVLPRTDTMMVVEAVRKTMWTDESLNEIADELDKIKLTGTREQSESRKKAILCLCITGQGAAVKLKEHLTERLKSNLAGTVVVTRGYIEDSSIDRIIANTEKEYEILAIVGTINPDSGTYPVYICKPGLQPGGHQAASRHIKAECHVRRKPAVGGYLSGPYLYKDRGGV